MENRSYGMNMVAIGGGTGLSTLLRGIKHFVKETKFSDTRFNDRRADSFIDQLTAVVTVTDDGGSSGKIRRELRMLPPGDIRNCMVALAEDEALMTPFFKHRFSGDGNLQGHSFGNLFIAAISEVTGDFLQAIKLASKVLDIKGQIFPSTLCDVTLAAELANGEYVQGETNISSANSKIKRLWLEPDVVTTLPDVISAIANADIITIGPGSLFTSLLPNLLVPGLVDAIASSKAQKIFICNVMTQPGETDGFSALDHLSVIHQHAPQISFDAMLVNSTPLTLVQQKQCIEKGSFSLTNSASDRLFKQVPKMVDGKSLMIHYTDLIDEHKPTRHDSNKLADAIMNLAFPLQKMAQPA